jgi:hypothetical protein
MKLTEGTRIHDGNRNLHRASLRVSRIEVSLRVFQFGGVVSRIERDQQGPGLDEMVLFSTRGSIQATVPLMRVRTRSRWPSI